MKQLVFLFFLCSISTSTYCQTIKFSNFDLEQNMPSSVSLWKINTEKELYVDRNINPFFLEADFNGDEKLDIALFVADRETDKKGILFVHGGTLKNYLIGAGKQLSNGGDNFSWLNVWKDIQKNNCIKNNF